MRSTSCQGRRRSRVLVLTVLSVLGGLFVNKQVSSQTRPHVDSYAMLARVYQEGRDYQIHTRSADSPFAVLAPHGGTIEFYTEELALEFAAKFAWNLYTFTALKAQPGDLHLTSSRFDEPRALEMTQRMQRCLSLHGFREREKKQICVGGGNRVYAERMARALTTAFPDTEVMFPCQPFPGEHPENIVNRCQDQGVQLELSIPFRQALRNDVAATGCFLDAVAAASIDGSEPARACMSPPPAVATAH